MSPSFILAHHLFWNSCFLIQFEQLWEFGLKQNEKALPLCLMLTFKLERGLLGLNRRCVVSSCKEHFFFFLFNRKLLTETKRPGGSVEKSEHLMWLFQWKIKRNTNLVQHLSPYAGTKTDWVRSGNLPHWGSKVIKRCCKPKLWMDLSHH